MPKLSEIIILENWRIYMGGSRVGANVSIDDLESGPVGQRRTIAGTIKGWLDADRKLCARKDAAYCIIARWLNLS